MQAPAAAGHDVLIYQMVEEGVAFFPQYLDGNVSVGSPQAPADDATYAPSGQPSTFTTGQTATYRITLTNSGSATWLVAGSTPFHLRIAFAAPGSTGIPGGTLYTDQGYALAANVTPGQGVTLTVGVLPPSTAGSYTLIYQMVQEGIAFFPQHFDTNVTVSALQSPAYDATYVPSGQPGTFTAGQMATYNITLTNTGTATWLAGGSTPFHLRIAFAAPRPRLQLYAALRGAVPATNIRAPD
ncbi:MAG: hypothetical protein ACR2JC_02940 [Chloroflexota bacterium]